MATEVYASGPLFESDLRLVAKQGVRSIVNTRPDNESTGQPLSADLAKIAKDLGMTFVHLPVDPGSINRETAEAFLQACDELERPLVVCGRSGAQSTRIWETTEAMSLDS